MQPKDQNWELLAIQTPAYPLIQHEPRHNYERRKPALPVFRKASLFTKKRESGTAPHPDAEIGLTPVHIWKYLVLQSEMIRVDFQTKAFWGKMRQSPPPTHTLILVTDFVLRTSSKTQQKPLPLGVGCGVGGGGGEWGLSLEPVPFSLFPNREIFLERRELSLSRWRLGHSTWIFLMLGPSKLKSPITHLFELKSPVITCLHLRVFKLACLFNIKCSTLSPEAATRWIRWTSPKKYQAKIVLNPRLS